MSRGFNATFGGTSSDLLATNITLGLGTNFRSVAFWFYINGAGGNNIGEIFCVGHSGGSGGAEYFRMNTGTTTMLYARKNSGGTLVAQHTYNAPSLGVWTHGVVTHDRSSGASTAPTVYYNGVKQSNVSTTAPTIDTAGSTDVLWVGNRGVGSNVACWDGMISEFTIWDGIILSDADALTLAGGAPGFSIHPEYIAACLPLIGTAVDSTLPPAISTLTGTAQGRSDPSIQSTWRLSEWYDRAINVAAGGFTAKFRRTLSPVGSRVGSRQTHGWGA